MFGRGYVPVIQYMEPELDAQQPEPDMQKKPGGKGKKADYKEAGNKKEDETDGETDSGDMSGQDLGKEKKRPMTDDDTPLRLRRKKTWVSIVKRQCLFIMQSAKVKDNGSPTDHTPKKRITTLSLTAFDVI